MYFDDILDMNEALDVWSDMNDLEKTAPATARQHSQDGVMSVDRDSALGRMFG